jgi:hypothetical protein
MCVREGCIRQHIQEAGWVCNPASAPAGQAQSATAIKLLAISDHIGCTALRLVVPTSLHMAVSHMACCAPAAWYRPHSMGKGMCQGPWPCICLLVLHLLLLAAHLFVCPDRHVQVIHVPTAPALVTGVVVRVVAGACVSDHDHHGGSLVITHILAVQPLAIPISKRHLPTSHFLALATAAAEVSCFITARCKVVESRGAGGVSQLLERGYRSAPASATARLKVYSRNASWVTGGFEGSIRCLRCNESLVTAQK